MKEFYVHLANGTIEEVHAPQKFDVPAAAEANGINRNNIVRIQKVPNETADYLKSIKLKAA